jgi:selenocysteine lyase/cysteine desulfurase
MPFTSSIAEFRSHLAQLCAPLAGKALNAEGIAVRSGHHCAGFHDMYPDSLFVLFPIEEALVRIDKVA